MSKKKSKRKRRSQDAFDIHAAAVSIPDYHVFPFRELGQQVRAQVDHAYVTEPAKLRLQFFAKHAALGRVHAGTEAHELLRGLADALEGAMRATLQRHSAFYWLHLYRRIGVGVHHAVESKRDANTVGLLRLICETAIQKHGRLDIDSDVTLVSEIGWSNVLGGMFEESWSRYLGEATYQKFVSRLPENQWVLPNFAPQDMVDIYAVEGLAYHYWRCMANLRAVAKGSHVTVDHVGRYERTESPETNGLIEAYDRRITRPSLLFTNSGLVAKITSFSQHPLRHLLLCEYNDSAATFAELYKNHGPIPSDFRPNFVAHPIDAKAFLDGHSVLASPFQDRYGIPLAHQIALLVAVPALAISKLGGHGLPPWRVMYELTKRAYRVLFHSHQGLVDELVAFAEEACIALSVPTEGLPASTEAFVDRYTASDIKQEQMSLWTYGPRCIFIPYRNAIVMDVGCGSRILLNLFFGVRDPHGQKGYAFEESARAYLMDRGFEVLPYRDLKSRSGAKRETDIALRIKDQLVLCDCRSIERPLDIEIGAPGRLEKRKTFLLTKLDAIQSIHKFAIESPTGSNYDFSWASSVHSVGLSPFYEWIDSEEAEWWIDRKRDIPRIMTLTEMTEWLESL